MKDKKRNINQPQQRDPWSALQAQLGLLSTPVQHEQVSMVGAVDPREESPEPQADNAIVENVPAENQIVNGPEEETVTVSFEEKRDTFQMFEFDDFGECDIPPNAFGAPPKEKEVVQPAELQTATELTVDFLQDAVEEQTIVAETQPETAAAPLDPLASAELPTFLWQPKKPASIASPPASKPSAARESIKQTRDDIAKPKADTLTQETARSGSPDDLSAHSSGKKRRERGKDRSGRSEERKTSFDGGRREFADFGEEKRSRKPRETDREDDFGGFSPSFEEEKLDDVFPAERGEEDFGRSSKPSKRRRRDGKGEQEERSFSEPEFAGGFGTGLDDSDEMVADREWLDEPTSARKNDGTSRRRRGRKSNDGMEMPVSKENERDLRGRETRRDDRNDDAREDRGRQRSRNQETVPNRTAPSQKIVVPSWDDAVSGIIENNMRRHPAKNDRKSNGGGGRGRRR